MCASPTHVLRTIVMNYTKYQYEKPYKNKIPQDIKKEIARFSQPIIDSALLNIKQDINLYAFISKQLKNYVTFKQLFCASSAKFNIDLFEQHCRNKTGTIILIKTRSNHIIGGYTSKPWDSFLSWEPDDCAFLFVIESNQHFLEKTYPSLIPITKSINQVPVGRFWSWKSMVGLGHDIIIKSNPNESGELQIQQQTPTIILRTIAVKEAISKFDFELKILDYEVFEITYSC